MMKFRLRLPDPLFTKVKELADKERISVNQFILMAVTKEVSRLEATEFYQIRVTKAANPEEAHRLLQKAPNIKPENSEDRLE